MRSIRSFPAGDIKPFPLPLARVSKLEGNLSRGRTNVCTEHGSCSGGVGSSNCTGALNQHACEMTLDQNLPSRHIRPETQTISRLFSRWFTTVRRARLMIINGGGSGALSPIGITFFGSETLASSLHQEICVAVLAWKRTGTATAYPLVLHDGILHGQPAGSHDLSL